MTSKNEINELVEHFFRHESGKMISVLTGVFGSANFNLVEDIVQDTLIEAISNWTYKGVPNNPTGWLYVVARNKTLNAIKRGQHHEKYLTELSHSSDVAQTDLDIFSEEIIADEQLRMMFMCCHPAITKDSQIALILKTLCGFNISEIAKAFLTNRENINKRLVRARKTIRAHNIPFEVPQGPSIDHRIDAVLEAIYLLFNEGYSASSGDEVIRSELCEESIRLAEILVSHKYIIQKSSCYALLALMQLNASRFKAREDKNGNILTLSQQNRAIWDYHLMEKGFNNLEKAAQDPHITIYHILASISAYHCSAKDFDSVDWKSILALYNKLGAIDNSPIVILNRAFAISKVVGVKEALQELQAIENDQAMKSNYLFYSVRAEFYMQLQAYEMAQKTLKKAIDFAPLDKEKLLLQERFRKYFEKRDPIDVPFSKS